MANDNSNIATYLFFPDSDLSEALKKDYYRDADLLEGTTPLSPELFDE